MRRHLFLSLVCGLLAAVLLSGCAVPKRQVDYTSFKKSQPRTIVILPPLNDTNDAAASYSLLSQMTLPVAEAGYYVVPVAVMEETFKQNGLTTPNDIQAVSMDKLRQYFGADAAIYPNVTKYGSVYKVVDSVTVVSASAKMVDLRSGDTLWVGSASADGKELGGNVDVGSGSIIGALVQAAVKQVAHTVTDESHDVAALAANRLLKAGPPDGLLYGPRSPKVGTDW
jgi:hypothetical protein